LPALLSRFPPTLFITGSRAPELSSAINTHRLLTKAGVRADLHVWDGMGHGFFNNVDLPESREAFDVIARFFQVHLGHRRAARLY
jgi:acetyl esterase/lipase